MNSNAITRCIFIFSILISVELIASTNEKELASAVHVEVEKITPSTFILNEDYYGVVAPINSAVLQASGGGYVHSVDVKINDHVNAEQKLCNIDAKEFELKMSAAQLDVKIKKEHLQLLSNHFKLGNTSKLKLDTARLELLQAESILFDRSRQFFDARCISPINGIVLNRYIDPYSRLASGAPTFHIADITKLKVFVGIPENRINAYQPGDIARIISNNGSSYIGKIHSVSNEIDKNTQTFQLELHVDNKDTVFLPGQTVKIELQLIHQANVLVVPSNAIIHLLDKTVAMISLNGHALMKDIVVGESTEGKTLIKQGLRPGDLLVIKGQHQIVDGTTLTHD